MTLTVAPTQISSGEPFSASIDATITMPRDLVQLLLRVRHPEPVDTLTITAAARAGCRRANSKPIIAPV